MAPVIGFQTANLIAWGLLLLYCLPGAWNALFGSEMRRGDPMRLGCAMTASVFVGFSAKWLFWPDSIILWQALYVASIADAALILLLARTYGRGPYV